MGEIHDDHTWNIWTLTPDIVLATALTALIYVVGALPRKPGRDSVQPWRHALFAAGLGSIFLALASPVDYVAEHLFAMHQIQHLLLRMVGPMLIMLSAPQGVLTSGIPRSLRHGMVAPFVASPIVRSTFSVLAQPVVITVLYVLALYAWQYPPWHDAAILNETVHYVMHLTMLAAGLLFWWRIFDIRPGPKGLTYGKRLMMLWVIILSNIGLGAYTTLKSAVLYPAYDVVGRLFDVAPLTDETVGGFIIWMPSSMMCLIAVIIIIHRWGRYETRLDLERVRWLLSNSEDSPYPTTGEALVATARPKNWGLAVGILIFAAAVFGSVIFIGYLDHLSGGGRHRLFAHAPSVSNEVVR